MDTKIKILIGCFIVAIGVLVWALIGQVNKNNELNNRVYVLDSIHKLDSTQYSQIALEYQTTQQANVDLKKSNESLSEKLKKDEEVRQYTQVTLKGKKQTYQKIDSSNFHFYDPNLKPDWSKILTDTVGFTIGKFKVFDTLTYKTNIFYSLQQGYDSVKIDINNSLYRVSGASWLIPNRGYNLTVDPKPFTLDLLTTEDANGVFNSYVDTRNPDLEAVTIRTRVLRYQKSFWENLMFMGTVGATNFDTYVGLTGFYKKIGIGVITGYDYRSLTIEKNNVKFGGNINIIF